MLRHAVLLSAMASPCMGGKFQHMNGDVTCE